MAFEKKVPAWNAPGIEPPDSLKEIGFTPGYKPPAEYFNWFMSGMAAAAQEMQENAVTHEADKGNPHRVTAKQISALPTWGGTLTGNLEIKKTSSPAIDLSDSDDDSSGSMKYNVDVLSLINRTADSNATLELHSGDTDLQNMFQLVVNNADWYNIYGEHNKPTPADVGAAPAGYGLGGDIQKVTTAAELDAFTVCGWKAFYNVSTPLEAGGTKIYTGVVRCDAYSANYCVQTICSVGSGYFLQRVCSYGEWGEWEWINPILYEGTEYRTTERYAGKPVYVKLIDFGALPNATSKTVSTGVDATKIIRDSVRIISSTGNYLPSPYFLADGSLRIKHMFAYTDVQITTNSDHSSSVGEVTIWYVKD